MSANASKRTYRNTGLIALQKMTAEQGTNAEHAHSVPEGGVAADSNGINGGNAMVDVKNDAPSSPKKRTRTNSQDRDGADSGVKRVKGVAPIKAECAPPPP